MSNSNEIKVIVLQSAIGDAERKIQWDAFKARFDKETSFLLKETSNPSEADFVFLSTGGVEQFYAMHAQEMPRAIYAPRMTNAFAAMNEIRGYLAKHKEHAFCYDDSRLKLEEFVRIARAFQQIQRAKIASFGDPAPWLIASFPTEKEFQSKFRTTMTHVAWEELDWPSQVPIPSLVDHWRELKAISVDHGDFSRACQLSSSMIEWAKKHGVDGITVGCFPLLAQHVSACLAVSDLLEAGYAAACENDICSVMAMLIAQKLGLCSQPPWMANLVDIQGDKVTLQHCTIARSCLESCQLMTHFESDANVAVAGTFPPKMPVTIFRFNETFDKACIAEGTLIESGPNTLGCRTSATIQLNAPLSEPLGNHHILISGHVGYLLREFCQMMNIIVI